MSMPIALIKEFGGSSPIFPVSDSVLFPKTGQAYHIFEQCYIDMVKACLASDRFITVTLLKESNGKKYIGDPPIYNTGTLAYLFESKNLPNGEYDIMLMGLKKVLINEASRSYTFRRGAMTILNEIAHWPSEDADRQRLLDTFARFLTLSNKKTSLGLFDNPIIDSHMLTNMISALLPIPVSEQQKLLELQDVSLRLDVVLQYLEKEIDAERRIDELKDILPIPPDWN